MDIPRSNDLARSFYKFICDEFDKRLDKIENVMPLSIATLVDPRFPRSYSQNILAKARAKVLIEDLLKKYIRESANTAEAELAVRSTTVRSEQGEGEIVADFVVAPEGGELIPTTQPETPANKRPRISRPLNENVTRSWLLWLRTLWLRTLWHRTGAGPSHGYDDSNRHDGNVTTYGSIVELDFTCMSFIYDHRTENPSDSPPSKTEVQFQDRSVRAITTLDIPHLADIPEFC
ncbi:uncharacterized protein LOC117647723 [Thrips palmi]|uniref:Uncharacterized protein LOC117647723 n=1 Tax=Thrips palmi TaxID=161013 RepID=A0A6P8Z6E2_THRPL|nr:uncharacterized protein LOC117647723 [Thrips palmi]